MIDTAKAGSLQFRWEIVAQGEDGPGPRSRHCLAYDRAAMAAVLFGGIVWDDDAAIWNDTWELQDGEWRCVASPRKPLPRHRGAMVYDAHRG